MSAAGVVAGARRRSPATIPGESPTRPSAARQPVHSSSDIAPSQNGFRIPSARGSSGHRSRASNTNGLRRKIFASAPGTTAVSGVEVANTRSHGSRSASAAARRANFANPSARRGSESRFE